MNFNRLLTIICLLTLSFSSFADTQGLLEKSDLLREKLEKNAGKISAQTLDNLNILVNEALKLSEGRSVLIPKNGKVYKSDVTELFCPDDNGYELVSAVTGVSVGTGTARCGRVLATLKVNGLFCPDASEATIRNAFTGIDVSTGTRRCGDVLKNLKNNGLFCLRKHDDKIVSALTGATTSTFSKSCHELLGEVSENGLFCRTKYSSDIVNAISGLTISIGDVKRCHKVLKEL